MPFDIDTLIRLASFTLSIGALFYAHFASRRKDVDARLEASNERIERLQKRISTLEQTVAAMPEKDDVHHLQLMLSDLGGDMKAMRATMDGMSESMTRTEGIVSRHEQFLRESK